MRKSVLIPMFLLDKIIELLYWWDVSEHSLETRYDHDIVLWALKIKKNNCNPFKTYDSAVAAALSDEAREAAVFHSIQYEMDFEASHDDWDSEHPF